MPHSNMQLQFICSSAQEFGGRWHSDQQCTSQFSATSALVQRSRGGALQARCNSTRTKRVLMCCAFSICLVQNVGHRRHFIFIWPKNASIAKVSTLPQQQLNASVVADIHRFRYCSCIVSVGQRQIVLCQKK